MFNCVTVTLSPQRQYTAYVAGEHVEIIGTIDGYSAHFGSARWNGSALDDCSGRLARKDALAALVQAMPCANGWRAGARASGTVIASSICAPARLRR